MRLPPHLPLSFPIPRIRRESAGTVMHIFRYISSRVGRQASVLSCVYAYAVLHIVFVFCFLFPPFSLPIYCMNHSSSFSRRAWRKPGARPPHNTRTHFWMYRNQNYCNTDTHGAIADGTLHRNFVPFSSLDRSNTFSSAYHWIYPTTIASAKRAYSSSRTGRGAEAVWSFLLRFPPSSVPSSPGSFRS